MTRSYLRGHQIIHQDGRWLFEDNKEPTVHNKRPCGYCDLNETKEGHDGCLGTLPGDVMNACCGHGRDDMAYIQYWETTKGGKRDIIIGKDAVTEQGRLAKT